MSGSELAVRLRTRVYRLESALRDLCVAESRYRAHHDAYGAADPRTGRAWDMLRRCGDSAREVMGE